MKKTLALILGVLMLMGCLSVSAANSALTVAEKPAKALYYEDFSGVTLDTVHVATGTATLVDGALKAAPAAAGNFATITFAPEGITTPVYLEFDVESSGMDKAYGAQIQMFLNSTMENFLDFRWYSEGNNADFIRSVSTDNPQVTVDEAPAHIKIKMDPQNQKLGMWVNGELMIDENDCADSIRHINNFTNIKSLKLDLNKAIASLKFDNFMVYSAVSSPVPTVGEEIYHHTFDSATVDANMVETVGAATVSQSTVVNDATVATGKLYVSSSGAGGQGAKIYLQSNKEALTGQYVVEMMISGISYTSDQYHRLTFGETTCYLRWSPKAYRHPSTSANILKELKYRFYGQSPEYADFTSRMEEFSATGDSLKVTHLYDTTQGTVKVWFNDVYAGEISSTNAKQISIPYIYINGYSGTITISDIRVYRPATYTFDATTGLSITEDANSVKIATNAAKDGRLYFATYTGEDDAKTVSALGSAALSLAPGKIYTISKADWEGAKAFFWNNNQQPIVNAWDLQ